MKKLSLLIALCMLISIGGVYATWVYSEKSDVADITGAKAITLTEATFSGTYGTYAVDTSQLNMQVDPKEGTAHVTSLVITGDLVITFKPNTYAPDDVKNNGVDSTFQFSLSNSEWKYGSEAIMTVDTAKHDITWTKGSDGNFTYTISAADLANYLTLTEITLDTKAEYNEYDEALTNGQIVITISDGQTSATT